MWWTSQRAFPDGRIDEHLDEAKAAGVQTIAFHEDWIPVQNNPTPQKDFKAIVEKCHARGGRIDAHQSGYLCPAMLAFADGDGHGRGPASGWFPPFS